MKFFSRLAATAALVVAALALLALPAGAHTGFESSDPSNGSTVASALDRIVLTFSGEAEPAGEGFVILEPTGVTRIPDTITPGPEGKIWTLGFDPPLTGGPAGVRWTVQAPDAHPIEGSFSFTIDVPAQGQELDDGIDEAAAGSSPSTGDGEAPATGLGATTSTAPGERAVSSNDAAVGAASPDGRALKAFLAETETEVPNADGVGAFGRVLGFVGTMLGIGGLAFAVAVLHGHRRDSMAVLRLVRFSALLVFVGTAIDFLAHLAVAGEGWSTLWKPIAAESVVASSYGIAIGLRSASALILLLASSAKTMSLTNHAPLDMQPRSLATVGAGNAAHSAIHPPVTRDNGRQDRPRDRELLGHDSGEEQDSGGVSISVPMMLSIIALLVSFTFDGHTVNEGNRWITGAIDMVHVVAGAVWAGGVLSLAIVLWRRHRRGLRLDALELAARFSVIAGAALAAAGVAGTILAVIILDSLSELWTTPWGLLLIAKFTAVAAAAGLGTFNHFVVIPWMEADPSDDSRSLMLRNTATGEAILLCIVLVVTAFLVGAAST